MTRLVLERDQEVSFRTSLVRSNLLVDTRPTYDTVEQYYHHLLAECEAMAVTGSASTAATTTTSAGTAGKPEPKMRPMKPNPKGTPPPPPAPTRTNSPNTTTSDEDPDKRAQTPCRYYGKSFKGCARGTKCPFLHTWEGNEKEKSGRCNLCGGKHAAKDCPTKRPSTTTRTSSTTSTTPPTTTPTRPPSSSSAPSPSLNKSVRIDEVPQVEGIPSRASASSSEAVPDLKEVLADVGKMLKAMTTTTAMKKFNVVQEVETENVEEAVMVKAMNDFEDGEVEEISSGVTNQEPEPECEAGAVRGLLDSGASHALKEATQDEYDRGLPIKETLAGEDTKVLRQNICGTVLVTGEGPQAVQPIVPMGALVEDLGCSLQWKKGCSQAEASDEGLYQGLPQQ